MREKNIIFRVGPSKSNTLMHLNFMTGFLCPFGPDNTDTHARTSDVRAVTGLFVRYSLSLIVSLSLSSRTSDDIRIDARPVRPEIAATECVYLTTTGAADGEGRIALCSLETLCEKIETNTRGRQITRRQ